MNVFSQLEVFLKLCERLIWLECYFTALVGLSDLLQPEAAGRLCHSLTRLKSTQHRVPSRSQTLRCYKQLDLFRKRFDSLDWLESFVTPSTTGPKVSLPYCSRQSVGKHPITRKSSSLNLCRRVGDVHM